jgi:hypothetical protein
VRKGDARSEMDRLFAEMPGAPAALVLVVATRGRLGYDGPRNDPSHQAAEATAETHPDRRSLRRGRDIYRRSPAKHPSRS